MTTEYDMVDFAVRTLFNYNVTITDDTSIQENRSDVFTPFTIDASFEESADFQRIIEIMRRILNRQSDYIKLFQ